MRKSAIAARWRRKKASRTSPDTILIATSRGAFERAGCQKYLRI
jgi:hypothetical protein